MMRAQASTDDAPAGTPRTAPPRRRRWRRRLLWLPVWLLLFSVLQVLVLRFVDPPFTSFMAIRQFEAWMEGDWRFRIAHDWRDLDEIAPSLPVARPRSWPAASPPMRISTPTPRRRCDERLAGPAAVGLRAEWS